MRLDSAFADRVTALVLFALGAATLYGGYVMDRLEVRRIHPASIPGLVPMLLGVALIVCALALAWSARPGAVSGAVPGDAGAPATDPDHVSWGNFWVVVIWSAVYALAAVGSLPFAPVTAIYVAGFSLWFLRDGETGRWPSPPTIAGIVIFAIGIGWGVAALFRYGFLVRLP